MRNLNFIIRLSQHRHTNTSYFDRGKWRRYAIVFFNLLKKQS